MKILTAAQIREVDRLSTTEFGIPGILLMENAGMRVVEAIQDRFDQPLDTLTVAILCGKGNNGGDGFVIARQLIQKGCVPFVYLFAAEEDVKGDALTNLEILKAIGAPPTIVTTAEDWAEERLEILDVDVVIDALFGTGLTKRVDGLIREVIDSLEDFNRATIAAVDLPSGLMADSAHISGPAVDADFTVTFTALKPCLVSPPASRLAGDVIVSQIGNPSELLDSGELNTYLIEPDMFAEAQQVRHEESHKGDFGRVLVIAGSRGKSGAAAMSGQAALRAGAGLVTVATAASALPIVAASMPELMMEALPETESGSIARHNMAALLDGKTIVAIGPGLTTHDETVAFVRTVVRDAQIPIVIDADALNALDDIPPGAVLTPHPGEMARLLGRPVEDRVADAREFATAHKVYLVLKGFRTVIATPDGSIYINSTGNPGMASGGTGDILTGMIAGFLAQEHLGDFVERLCLAVYLHGLAGDLAADDIGEESMVATDILRFLPAAWKTLRGIDSAEA